ncbi:proline iminopeptidase-family hydrolase [Pareuzebyella sediminis]|uniref:proline iminopeptidase-family hydrolase n=1 Tax=Pareuzebyella sediminis TaxID=2607998 RepID=UPI0011F02115|nr:proline iminopeptidase-family hydrolase [Pareuzebyella sediminis]
MSKTQRLTVSLKLSFFIFGLFLLFFFFSCKEKPRWTPSEGYVAVKGGEIWYGILGEGNKKPIMLLHGGPGSTSQYFYQLEPLSEERPIILFDQLGSGRSTYHTDTTLMTIPNFVSQVAKLKEALDLEEYFVLGHSWGSALAMEYYLAHPDGIEGIIFSSPLLSTSLWEADADTLIRSLPDSIQNIISIAEKNRDFDTSDYKYADSIYWSKFGLRKGDKKHFLDTVDVSPNKVIYKYMWGPSEFMATGTLKNFDRVKNLAEIKLPVLFLTGEFDEARPSTVSRFKGLVPDSRFEVIKEAGHSTMRDNAEQYNKAIAQFLNEIDS